MSIHRLYIERGECGYMEPVKITIRISQKFLNEIDFLVDQGDFPNRTEAIRAAIRDMLYQRVPLVAEKMEQKADIQRKMDQTKEFRKEYLKQ
jgi:Arc/MetJ-type ribon-helix-helix transcriptional regulator